MTKSSSKPKKSKKKASKPDKKKSARQKSSGGGGIALPRRAVFVVHPKNATIVRKHLEDMKRGHDVVLSWRDFLDRGWAEITEDTDALIFTPRPKGLTSKEKEKGQWFVSMFGYTDDLLGRARLIPTFGISVLVLIPGMSYFKSSSTKDEDGVDNPDFFSAAPLLQECFPAVEISPLRKGDCDGYRLVDPGIPGLASFFRRHRPSVRIRPKSHNVEFVPGPSQIDNGGLFQPIGGPITPKEVPVPLDKPNAPIVEIAALAVSEVDEVPVAGTLSSGASKVTFLPAQHGHLRKDDILDLLSISRHAGLKIETQTNTATPMKISPEFHAQVISGRSGQDDVQIYVDGVGLFHDPRATSRRAVFLFLFYELERSMKEGQEPNFFTSKDIAKELGTSYPSINNRVRDIRAVLDKALPGRTPAASEIIETHAGKKGYRINPRVCGLAHVKSKVREK